MAAVYDWHTRPGPHAACKPPDARGRLGPDAPPQVPEPLAATLVHDAPSVLIVALLGWASGAHAHVLPADARGIPHFGWSFEPWVVGLLIASGALYVVGYVRLRVRSRRSRPVRAIHLAAFLLGWLALVAALDSPLDTLAAALFSAHMIQHEVLMLIAAPLLVTGRPLAVWIWALPAATRGGVGRAVRTRWIRVPWRVLTMPLIAWMLHAATLWAWHAPAFFEAALARPGIHTFQHASFLVSALLFWWTVFGNPARGERGAHALLSLFTTMVHTSALGALLTLAPGIWYPSYIESTSALGFDPLLDQQLGGLVMWVPGGLAYLIGGLVVGARWLTRRTPRPAVPAISGGR
ncbi:membrane protein [Caballeronia choica]|uniref:Membrane protein n=1 Tax=Caballeronia choica TaxID=326476 RepID=A0A158IR99_9BURK|nr:membrane protein [Caballeronia choica]